MAISKSEQQSLFEPKISTGERLSPNKSGENERQKRIKNLTVEDIIDTYRNGYITAEKRNNLLREKAHLEIIKNIENKGPIVAFAESLIHHINLGFENLKNASAGQPITFTGQLKQSALFLWGEVQIASSLFTAFGEISGHEGERAATALGASPSTARAVNIGVDLSSGFFLPVGKASSVIGKVGGAASRALGMSNITKVTTKEAIAAATEALTKRETEFAKLVQEATDVLAKRETETASAVEKATEFLAKKESTQAKFAKEAEDILAKKQAAEEAAIQEATKKAEEGIAASDKAAGEEAAAAGKALEEEKAAIEAITNSLEVGKAATPAPVKKLSAADSINQEYQTLVKKTSKAEAEEELPALIKKSGLTEEQVRGILPGKVSTPQQAHAYLTALDKHAEELAKLSQDVVGSKVVGGQIAEEAETKFINYLNDLVTAIPDSSKPKGKVTDMLVGWDPESMARGDMSGAIETVANDISKLDSNKLKNLIINNQSGFLRLDVDWWNLARGLYQNLLMARPTTQIRNIVGNSIGAGNAILDTLAGSAFGISSKGEGLVGQSSFFLSKGMMHSMADAFAAFKETAKTGIRPGTTSKFDYIENIPGVLGLPGRVATATDEFFKTILRNGSMYREAMEEAVHMGLKTESEISAHVAMRMQSPTESMLKNAEAFAMANTFQNDLGTIGRAVQNVSKNSPLFLWFPFVKTQINLGKYAWGRTPGLQLISKQLYRDLAEGGVKADMAIGRITMSNFQAMFIYELAKEGLITGYGPIDANLRRVWLTQHEPYSVGIGKGAIPITDGEPASTTIGMIGDFAQVLNQLDEPTAGQVGVALTFSIMQDMAKSGWTDTLSNLVDIASSVKQGHEPSTFGMKVLMSPVTNVVTGGPLVTGIARAIDPVKRQVRSVVDDAVNRIPGYSKILKPDLDPFGNPVVPPIAIGGSWIGIASPLRYVEKPNDWVTEEANKLGVKIPAFPDHIGGPTRDDFDIRSSYPTDRLPVNLNNEQRYQWQMHNHEAIYNGENGIEAQLRNNPDYIKATPPMKREMFMDFMAEYRKNSELKLLLGDNELHKKTITNDVKRLLPLMNQIDQVDAKQMHQDTLQFIDSLTDEEKQNMLKWGNTAEDPPEELVQQQ